MDKEVCVSFLSPAAFAALPGAHSQSEHSCFYTIQVYTQADGRLSVAIKNTTTPQVAQIERDDAWQRRRSLGQLLATILGEPVDEDARLERGALVCRLLTQSYQEAFSAPVDAHTVLRQFFRNSQERFEAQVQALLAGKATHTLEDYTEAGVESPAYSHIRHFSYLYAQQLRLVKQLLLAYPDRVLTVVDQGCGFGHFLLTLWHRLKAEGLGERVRLIGIDCTEKDLAFAREAFQQDPEAPVSFVIDDLTAEGYADRLRQLRPDVVVANPVLEHLPLGSEVRTRAEAHAWLTQRHLQDWVLAARLAVSISVPIERDLSKSCSSHHSDYDAPSIHALGRSLERRTGYALRAECLEETSLAGLIQWVRSPEVVRTGGFSGTLRQLCPNRSVSAPSDPLLADFAKPFDPEEYARVRRAPQIAKIVDTATFAQQGQAPPQVRQLVIKLPQTDVLIPEEFAQFEEALQHILDHNRAANPQYALSYAYLNVFRGRTGFNSYRGLSLSCHGDQMQSLNTELAYLPDWSYIVSSTLPTVLYEQAFDLSAARARFQRGEQVNLYEDFCAQAQEAHAYRSENFGIYLLSPYVVHAASLATEDVERVFLKVAFSTKRFFDNRELRRNPAFNTEAWYHEATVGYSEGWLSHAHWNERFLRADLCP